MSFRLKSVSLLLLLACAGAARADSLWTTPGGDHLSLYADHKASRVGDIVTVVVQEAAAAQSTQNKQSTRTSTVNDTVGQFIFTPASSGLGTHAGQAPSLQVGGNSSYTGGGQVTNSQSVTSRAAVIVTDVLPNGNFVIEGVRLITFSGETQYMVLHGVVRPDDIASDDTVNSTNIADAGIEVVGKGALTDSEKLGWFSKFYEMLRPF
jgi:flagellar L-ring protein precursor FlgH